MSKILVVDDEEKICFAFEQFLKNIGHQPLIASTAEGALKIIQDEKPQIVFLDIRLPGKSGLSALKDIKALDADIMVVLMTAYGTMDTAIQAMQQGAYEYLIKPIDLDKVKDLIARILRPQAVTPIALPEYLDRTLESESNILVGKSRAIQDIYKMIGLLTTNDVPVLIEGESGVGKELVAQAIHFKSDRGKFPFVAINCGAMPENLLETELFGHEKGSFTGADNRKIGKFEHAANGTIFLDEIGDLQFLLQIKLLRVLQEKQMVRVGGLEPIPVRARIITATNKSLAEEMESGNFRSDLYYRLQLITLRIPPLRERREDIPDLVSYFVYKANRELNKNICNVETSTMDNLLAYDWPGNVRELENVIKRAAILTAGETISAHLPDYISAEQSNNGSDLGDSLVAKTVENWFKKLNTTSFFEEGQFHRNVIGMVEKTMIRVALESCRHNQVRAAEILGINRTTLRKKMEDFGLKK